MQTRSKTLKKRLQKNIIAADRVADPVEATKVDAAGGAVAVHVPDTVGDTVGDTVLVPDTVPDTVGDTAGDTGAAKTEEECTAEFTPVVRMFYIIISLYRSQVESS